MSYIKSVTTGRKAKDELKAGVDILADAVKTTLGPRGRHVAIEREHGAPLITKDGVTVARSINLKDRVQNMGAQLIKSVASSANASAGDGTTTATVLAQAIFGKGYAAIAAGHNPVLIKRGIDIATEKIVQQLQENSIKISSEEDIKNVAIISANNDIELGSMIAEAVSSVGEYGFINVEEGTGHKTDVLYVEGLKIGRGLLSTDFISNAKTLSCDMDNPLILCYDDKLESIKDISELLTECANEGRSVLIIAKDFTEESVAHLVYNKVQNKLNFCPVKAPGFGDTRREMLKDICVMTGAKLLTNDHGQKFKGVTVKDLGTAQKISVGLNETTIIGGSGNKEGIAERIETLEAQLKNVSMHDYQQSNIKERIARMTGGAATFRVGGASDSEVKEKKDRVEDAINAVRSALQEGVVSGGGSSLVHAAKILKGMDMSNMIEEEKVGVKIVQDAVKIPLAQILENAGDSDKYYEVLTHIESGTNVAGYDALKRIMVSDMFKHGVIDPTKVVRTALEQASSASGTLLTTEVTISFDIADE